MAIEVLYHGNCFHEHKNPDIIDICIKKETSHSTSIFPFVNVESNLYSLFLDI